MLDQKLAWILQKNKEIHDVIKSHAPINGRLRSWDENSITRSVLSAIGTSDYIEWSGLDLQVSWNVFQAISDYETQNGDIALMVALSTEGGGKTVGVKHFEAKAYDPIRRRYSAINKEQMERMRDLVGHEMLLYSLWDEFDKYWLLSYYHVGAGSLPTALASLLLANGQQALNANAISFARALADAFCGRGLDFNQQSVSAFQAKLNAMDRRYDEIAPILDQPKAPAYVVLATATALERPMPTLDIVLSDRYQPLLEQPPYNNEQPKNKPKG